MITEHPFFRFYFDDLCPIRSIDVNADNYDKALAILNCFIEDNWFITPFKIVRYESFQNIY